MSNNDIRLEQEVQTDGLKSNIRRFAQENDNSMIFFGTKKRKNEIMEALLNEYVAVFVIDFVMDTMEPYYLKQSAGQTYLDLFEVSSSYSINIKCYVERDVLPEERERVTQQLNAKIVQKELAKGHDYAIVYPSVPGARREPLFVGARFIAMEPDNSRYALLTFANLDNEMKGMMSFQEDVIRAKLTAEVEMEEYTNVKHAVCKQISDPVHNVNGCLHLLKEHLDNPEQMKIYIERMQEELNDVIHTIIEETDEVSMLQLYPKQEKYHLSGKKAILVGIDPIDRELLTYLMVGEGMSVTEVANRAELMEYISVRENNHYDIIIIDWNIGKNHVKQAVNLIRSLKNKEIARTPIIGVGKEMLPDGRKQVADMGMDDYCEKPIPIQVFFSVLEHYAGGMDS